MTLGPFDLFMLAMLLTILGNARTGPVRPVLYGAAGLCGTINMGLLFLDILS